MKKSDSFKFLTLLTLFSFFFLSCAKKDPYLEAETHLQQKIEYLQDKGRMLEQENQKAHKQNPGEVVTDSKIVDVKKIFPKLKPMPEPWAAMITFSMVHTQQRAEIMRENFRIIFEFEPPFWVPVKMESEQLWRKNGHNVPWTEITKESNRDGWSMINSLLGLNGP
jgi:hypothetical protein